MSVSEGSVVVPMVGARAVAPGMGAHDRFEVDGLALLAAGHPDQVAEGVRASGRDDLVAQLLAADARVRQMDIDVPALQALVERAQRDERAAGGPATAESVRLRMWAQAMLAERLAVDGEVAGVIVARDSLDELQRLGPTALPPVALRYARARMLRVEAGAWIMLPVPDGLDEHVARRDLAVNELLSCGFTGEVHITRASSAGLVQTLLFEDILANHERLLDARAAVAEDEGSMWTPMIDTFVAMSWFELGDVAQALSAYERIERGPFHHPRIDVIPRYGRALFQLITAGASPRTIEGIERSLDEVRRHDPRVAQHWFGHVSHTLADMSSRAAVHFARLEADFPAVEVMSQTDRRVLQLRAAAVEGEAVAADEALRLVEAIDGFGHRRRAARTAVRLAHDLAATGDPDGAGVLRRWGSDRLPAWSQRTVWERWWCRSLDQDRSAGPWEGPRARAAVGRPATGAPALEVRVLSPVVEASVRGQALELSDAQAKLLLALVVAHPSPLHIEQVSDLLWPDEVLDATRSRLNSLVHRLRRALGEHGEALNRSGVLISLDPDRCWSDLWWYERALAGSPEQRRRALLSVRGNLGDAQFPYEDRFLDERRRISADWVRHARAAQRAGDVAGPELLPVLTALDLDDTELDLGT